MKGDDRDLTEKYSLGTILVKMQAVSREKVTELLTEQPSTGEKNKLGEILIARGLITRDQLEIALHAQDGLRSKNKMLRALAALDLAKISAQFVASFSKEVEEESNVVRQRVISGGVAALRPKVEK